MGQARADARDTTGQLSGLAASAQLMETLEQRTTTINGPHAEPPNGQSR
jgi:hypothetical protein